MSTAIKIRGLGKSYTFFRSQGVHTYKTLREDMVRLVKAPFSRQKAPKETFWALKEFSLDIKEGEKLGVLGHNGAGKSTLLKLLARITEPTSGYAAIKGRVGALLEVGTGFHPELSGRENIFLSGSILGMTRKEIQKRFDEIVDFAGVETFLDTPVKRYSSGMFLRLAFSVMAHLDADILIVDEVLAVGDAAFQKKCLNKMEGVANQGKTVIFVSHQMESIASLCPRSIFLKDGTLAYDGPSQEVIDYYYSTIRENLRPLLERKDRDGSLRMQFTDAWIENASGRKVDILHSGDAYSFVLTYRVDSKQDLHDMVFTVSLGNAQHGHITNFGCEEFNQSITFKAQSQGKLICKIPKLALNSGIFYYDLVLRKAGLSGEIEDHIKQAGSFSVEPGQFFEGGRVVPNHVFMLMEHEYQHQYTGEHVKSIAENFSPYL